MSKGKVTVIGVGRLGICSALIFEKAGYEVLGVDVFPTYVEQINSKKLVSHEPEVNDYLSKAKNFRAVVDIKEGIDFSDLLFICVDTPCSGHEKFYDHSKLSSVLEQIDGYAPSNKNVMIMCTVIPGYIRQTGRYLLRNCKNTTLNYNPEFIAQGQIISGFRAPDLVLLGVENDEIKERLSKFYSDITENEPFIATMSPESAELMKISLNCFITTKIAFANMIGDIADLTPGANKNDILAAIGHDSRVGTKCLLPGFAFGGPCFPRDNRALLSYAKSKNFDALIPRATDELNKGHSDFMYQQYLDENKDVYVFEKIGYKDNCEVAIIEESAKLIIAEKLVRAGKTVILRDKHHIIQAARREHGNIFQYEEIP